MYLLCTVEFQSFSVFIVVTNYSIFHFRVLGVNIYRDFMDLYARRVSYIVLNVFVYLHVCLFICLFWEEHNRRFQHEK